MRITEVTARRPLSTAAVVLTVLVLGMYGWSGLPVDFLPDITYPLIKVHVWWRGATPDEIDREIADPIEREMSTVDGLDYLESSSIEGMYTLQANFRYGVDVDVAYQDALAAMARATRFLPGDIDPPFILKADPSQLPVMQVTVRSDQWDLVKVRDWAENWLQDRLVAVPGVAGTEVVGGLKREIRVHLDPLAIERHRLGLADVERRLAAENLQLSAGRVTVGKREYIARVTGEFASLDEIRDVVVAREGDALVRLRDIAQVEDAHEEVRVITRLDGAPCVKMSVLKQADANTVEVARAVQRRLEDLTPVVPAGLRFGVVENQADYVAAALKGVQNAAIEAAVLLVLLMALFLGNWRQVVAMTWALPFTLLANFALMRLAGFSLNIFSLGGIVVAIAVDLDNSIIVIENITRLRRERPDLSPVRLVVTAVSEVGPAVIASTISFLALFLPFLLVPGLASLLFREMVLVVAGVMTISLVNAIAVTPVVMALLLRGSGAGRRESFFERGVARVREAYASSLGFVLRHRLAATSLFVVLLAGGGFAITRVGSEFLPRMDDGRVMVKVKLPTGVALEQTDAALRRIEEVLADDPLVESRFTLVGGKVWGLATYEIATEGEVDIQLVPRHQRKFSTDAYIRDLRRRLADVTLPAGKAMVMPMKVKGIRSVGESELEVLVRGPEIERIFDLAARVAKVAQDLPHVTNVRLSLDMTKPEYQVRLDRFRAAAMGISASEVAGVVQGLVRGHVPTSYREGDEFYAVRVMVPAPALANRAALESLPLHCTEGGCIRLRDIASVNEATGPVEIVRRDQVKQVVVQADAQGASVGQALRELEAALAGLPRDPGYEVSYGGQAQMMAEARDTLVRVVAFALFLSLVVLVVQFNRLRVPAIILGSVPFALAGLALVLWAAGVPMGATVVIGLLVVVAANVTEGVLLLTYAEEIRGQGALSAHDAVMQAARIRFRPRVMTLAGVIAGFLPIALNLEEGGDMLMPMAAGAIGGLLAGALVALYLMPVLYSRFAGTTIPGEAGLGSAAHPDASAG